jgi:hypothetical protein
LFDHKTEKPCAVAPWLRSPAIGPSLPSTALPASGSRGLSPERHSQPLRLPRSIASRSG